jgi:hypothetical protein
MSHLILKHFPTLLLLQSLILDPDWSEPPN